MSKKWSKKLMFKVMILIYVCRKDYEGF